MILHFSLLLQYSLSFLCSERTQERMLSRKYLGNQSVSCLLVYGVVAGVCQPRVAGTVGAEPFSAKLRYTGTEDNDYPNLIKLTVTMPHIDGKKSLTLKIVVPCVTH